MKTYEVITAEILKDHPTFVVKPYPANWFFGFLWKLGWRMGATTIGTTVFMHPDYVKTQLGADILRHERVHIDDQAKNPFWFYFSYFVLPPFGPGMRAYWEWRGYQEDLKTSIERNGFVDSAVIEHVVDQFCNVSYLWMYPFRKKITKRCMEFSNTYLKAWQEKKP